MPQVVVANRLTDGRVVYLDRNAQWTDYIRDADVAHDESGGERLLAAGEASAGRQEVVEPYLIDVDVQAGSTSALRYREHIRSAGPTIRADLGKQAEE